MSTHRDASASLFSHSVDVASGVPPHALVSHREEPSELLREMLHAQDKTNELLEELLTSMATVQKQRASELNQWRNAHPALAEACGDAAEALSRVQVEFLNRMTDEINDTCEDLVEGDFMLHEFIDRFGPRLAHLNGVIQVLSQLSSVSNPTSTQS
jgi:hypothetical protein